MNIKIKRVVELIKSSSYIIAFTGAGISTESGISDFRSPGGLWERFNPSEYAEYLAFLTHPEKFWSMHKELFDIVLKAQPNLAHMALSDLEHKYGLLKVVITQNIDFLHSRAGNTKVLELHGSGEISECLNCKKQFHYTKIQAILDHGEIIPRCLCGGLIKPKIVLFGERLPLGVIDEARNEIIASDLVIIVGSSLTIYPAATLPFYAHELGKKIIIINREPTLLDYQANVVLHGKAGEILSKIIHELDQLQ